ncbi:hypothetical protein ACSFA8_04915 [Variovorax sp. RT4R15]|uniref:hypothetical protein n=1 Tax=Variovorax sp. RT4R15 TaxID=3443737 RepID=UPI003F44D8B5
MSSAIASLLGLNGLSSFAKNEAADKPLVFWQPLPLAARQRPFFPSFLLGQKINRFR